MVRDPTINAFALPGGYIGVNTGLMLATENESELAGVLATKSHTSHSGTSARTADTGTDGARDDGRNHCSDPARRDDGMGDDAVQAALAVAQGMSVQKQIDFTRAHEREADRVGVGVLYQAGFDPLGIPTFFEKLLTAAATARCPSSC